MINPYKTQKFRNLLYNIGYIERVMSLPLAICRGYQ